ncbi:MAG: hypothetical protein IJ509_03300 [Bacilli bacterium]|nr:hypothetical protein [Bacilli bacterium]
MAKDIEKIVQGAASNVACETKDEVSKENLELIKAQLEGLSKLSDRSFIYELYIKIMKDLEENTKGVEGNVKVKK